MHPSISHRRRCRARPREASTPKLLPRSLNAALITTFKQTVKRPGDAKEFNYRPEKGREAKSRVYASTCNWEGNRKWENDLPLKRSTRIKSNARLSNQNTILRLIRESRLPDKRCERQKRSCKRSFEKCTLYTCVCEFKIKFRYL